MYKLIIFDFDGTIANTIEIGIPIFNKLANKYNFVELKKLEELHNTTLKEFFRMHKISKIRFPFYFREFLEDLNKSIDDVKIYPEIKDIIKKLNKNYKLGIVSANTKENIQKFLKKNDLEFCFDFIYNYQLIFGKSKVFKKLIKSKKLKKEDLIYIGDELRDIEASKKAGIDIISVTWGFNNKNILKKEKPTFIADKPEDILLYFKKNNK